MLALLGATTLMLVAGRCVLPAASGTNTGMGCHAYWNGLPRPPPGDLPNSVPLPTLAGEANLKPKNVEIHIIDDNFFLKWNSSSESVRNVTFSADYQILGTDNWKKLPGCQHISSNKCNFSSVELKNVFEKIELRIRAEEGNNTSTWYEVEPFVPFLEAQIGPPDVHLEAEDKAVILSISPPGTKDSIMWALDRSSFTYHVVIWKNSSSLEERTETVYPEDKIYKLSPEITYCLKVKAELRLQSRVGCYSPVYCINTTERHKVPSPENIQISADNQVYVLKWDYPYEHTTFQAQWLSAFLKKIPGKHSDKWKQIPSCENVTTTRCVFPRAVFSSGIYCVRVRASNGNGTSFWSEEKKFNAEMKTVILPPVISMRSTTHDSLRVSVGASEESENTPVNPLYPLIYEVIFWENTSNAERKVLEKRTDFTFPNLKPLTVYCVKARALVEDDRRNKGSNFSETVCEKTKPGNTSKTWLIAGICTILFSIPVVIYVVRVFLRCVKYVFFPSSKPPSSVDEYFSDQPLRNLLLSTSEEQTERCFIIENASIITEIEETNEIDEVHKEYSSQTSQDSGNYSNEDENSGVKISEEFLQQDSV